MKTIASKHCICIYTDALRDTLKPVIFRTEAIKW